MNHPVQKNVEAFSIRGIQVRTLNADEANPKTAKVPVLWGRFFAEYLPTAVKKSHNLEPEVFGVYFNYEADHLGYYNLLAGLKTEEQTQDTEQASVRVQSGSYLVFNARGSMPDALIQEWVRIWGYFSALDCEYKRSYTTDFEHYLGQESVAIYIAINDHA